MPENTRGVKEAALIWTCLVSGPKGAQGLPMGRDPVNLCVKLPPILKAIQMSDPEYERDDMVEPPFNPLPRSVIILAAVILGIETLFTLASQGFIGGPDAIGWRLNAVRNWAFADSIWEWMLRNQTFPPEQIVRLLSYTLIHISFTHAMFVVVFVLALGKLVSEVFGSIKMLVVFFLSAAIAAAGYGLILNEDAPLVGGYPGVYGLIGAYTFVMWINLAAAGENQARAFTLIGIFLGLQLVFAVFLNGPRDWVADLIGFVVGFLLSFVLVPGGWQRILDRLRQR